MGLKKWVQESRMALCMLAVQLIATGLQLLSRIILSKGTFVFALMTYRHVVGTMCVAPFALYLDRGKWRKLSWSAFFWLFMVALTGISMAMGFFYFGLRDTTATYATNFLNLIPIITFLFSTVLRIEKLGLQTRAGKIKTLGAALCLAGALTISLYKGKTINGIHHTTTHHAIIMKTKPNWTRGTSFLVGSILSYGMWFILQVKLLKVFPYKYLATMLICIIASIQQVAIGLCIDRTKAAWRLGWNLQLITIVYSGTLATGATFCFLSFAVAQRGPTYPSMFNPLSLILVAITEALFLGEDIRVGSLVGMLLIIVGLYSFLWAKNKELKSATDQAKLAAGGEQGKTVPESEAEMQLTAVVVPTASTVYMDDIEGLPNRNQPDCSYLNRDDSQNTL
ncbi:hypothetical protein RJ639_001740 [Escallonia herrerae]|uniref:WAT1-related protein n=1 Tax=Escallonia herrerae TaxID=1293975 RepID=A0AA88XFZ5_9ASTE|nr:hypothetical protein RJ639_001740 [Escallonia herrerae]